MPRISSTSTRCAFLTTFLFASLLASLTEAADPRLSIILPRGGQRGATTEFTFSGSRLNDAKEILFYDKGFEVESITPVNANSIKVAVKIAADVRLGEHTAQVRTSTGISDYRTFYVGPFAAVDEKEPNSDFATPQVISMNTTVHGVVANEDVDYYTVFAKKGQRVSAEVEGMRLGTFLFDPYVAIMNSKRFEVDAEDDTPLAYQDSVASIVAPEDGQYIIQVREAAYGGNGNARYRLHVGHFPRPTAVYPAGGKVGEELDVTYLGDPSGELKQKVKLPTVATENFGLYPEDASGIAPSPNWFRLTDQANSLEAEPNNAWAEATPATLPNALNGIISEAGDEDIFKITAKKGQTFEIECYARRVRSPLDPVMSLHNASGGQVAANDDSRGPDSYFRYTFPADGDYFLKVRDHLGRGGIDFVYRVEFQTIKKSLDFSIPRVTRYGQERQCIVVARGNKFATLVNARRAGFGGELKLDGNNLPKGVTMTAEPMRSNLSSMPVLFEAAPDAPIEGGLIEFTGRPVDEKVDVVGGFTNSAIMILGANQRTYWQKDVSLLPIAVVDEVPFTLEIVQPKVPLTRNGSMQLKIVAHRKEGFTAAINVQFPFRPPGVSASSSVNIPAGKNEVMYPINANGSAQIGKWKVFALANANVGGTVLVSSQLADLEITEPYVGLTLDRGAVEQGQNTEILVKVALATEFEGKAKLKLVGLPHKVVAPELEFTKDQKELVFAITTDPASPAGRHKNLFCQVTIPQNGEFINHRAGTSELRIDKPLPKPVAKPEPKPVAKPTPMPVAKKPEPKPAAPPKRLTRLEQLRLDAKKRAEAANGASNK